MATSYKAIEMANELANKLTMRLASLGTTVGAVVQSFDAAGNPMIKIGSGADGAASMAIQVLPIPWTAVDILGNASPVYTPHVVRIATEAAGGGNLGLTDWTTLAPVLSEAIMLGCRCEWYVSPNSTGVTKILAAPLTYFVSTYLIVTVEPNAYQPMLSSQ